MFLMLYCTEKYTERRKFLMDLLDSFEWRATLQLFLKNPSSIAHSLFWILQKKFKDR